MILYSIVVPCRADLVLMCWLWSNDYDSPFDAAFIKGNWRRLIRSYTIITLSSKIWLIEFQNWWQFYQHISEFTFLCNEVAFCIIYLFFSSSPPGLFYNRRDRWEMFINHSQPPTISAFIFFIYSRKNASTGAVASPQFFQDVNTFLGGLPFKAKTFVFLSSFRCPVGFSSF